MIDLLKNLDEKYKNKLIKRVIPSEISPMLATLTDNYFSSENWIFERKWDGYRILAYKNKDNVTLLSRNLNDYTKNYFEIAELLKNEKINEFIIDGEIVAFKGKEHNFNFLQNKSQYQNIEIKYYVFDILYLDGYDLTCLPLVMRKEILKQIITYSNNILYNKYLDQYGFEFYKEACKLGWEGIIAKQKNSIYESGRSKCWLKFKCTKRENFIIVGYTESNSVVSGFRSLLLGYYKNNKLQYAGKVGTGFNVNIIESLSAKLKEIQIPKSESPIANQVKDKTAHFVKPELVVKIQFSEWTNEGKLRHSSFLGLNHSIKTKDIKS